MGAGSSETILFDWGTNRNSFSIMSQLNFWSTSWQWNVCATSLRSFFLHPCGYLTARMAPISIQADSPDRHWRCASIYVAGKVSPSIFEANLSQVSPECDGWNCVINLASRFLMCSGMRSTYCLPPHVYYQICNNKKNPEAACLPPQPCCLIPGLRFGVVLGLA